MTLYSTPLGQRCILDSLLADEIVRCEREKIAELIGDYDTAHPKKPAAHTSVARSFEIDPLNEAATWHVACNWANYKRDVFSRNLAGVAGERTRVVMAE